MSSEFEEQRKRLADEFNTICRRFGLYGNVINYQPSPIEGSNRNKVYLIASRYPALSMDVLPEEFDLEYFLRRNQRSDRIVYTDVFIYELSADRNRMDAMDKLLEYCRYTEFISTLYGQYNMDPPEKLRRFEIRQLMDARDKQRRKISEVAWKKSTDALNDFFSNEQKKGLKTDWMNFFRSEKYPDNANPLEKVRAFRHRDDPEVSLKQLMDCTARIHTLEMQEHEYRKFSEIMQSRYPFVPYAVSEKEVIDNGAGPMAPALEEAYGKRVTGEHYAKMVEDHFVKDGWESIANLRASYFEVRRVSYSASDEPYIAAAFQTATLRYAQPDDLLTVENRGGMLQLHTVPKEDFMNFVSLAKANKLAFYIDHFGTFQTAALDKVNVVCSSSDNDLAHDIMNRIVDEKVALGHIVPEEERPALDDVLHQAECLPRNMQKNLSKGHDDWGRR